MRKFTLIWLGQLVSTIGSYMSGFALTLWAWELTGTATALALVGFFQLLPSVFVSLFAGIIVDRANRKHLIMLGDGIAAISTLSILLLYLSGNLAIWHLYLAAVVRGGFGQIQNLAYSTSIASLISTENYTRASSMVAAVHYGSSIIAPALAGALYPVIGLGGILPLDLATFGVAIATLSWITIPQINREKDKEDQSQKLWKPSDLWTELTFGVRYIWQRKGLRYLLLITALFWFAHDLGGAVYSAMILARSNNNSQTLGAISSAAGIGGVIGAIAITLWRGPKRRVFGMLVGYVGAGFSKIIFGLGRSQQIWIPAQFCSSLNFPLLGSCTSALWMEKVSSEHQGKVFAARSLVLEIVSALSALLAGPLGDRLFEPAMESPVGLTRWFVPLFGSGDGAGLAMLYVLCAIAMVLVGLGGFCLPLLRALANSADA
ncbi:MAG: MFS transporter [Cyanobacteria bacterium P01_F01_bin.153]